MTDRQEQPPEPVFLEPRSRTDRVKARRKHTPVEDEMGEMLVAQMLGFDPYSDTGGQHEG